jgi:hypothetical protein
VKSFGAKIFCHECNAQPYPDDTSIRETFDLIRTGDAWFCELHRPPREKHARRVAAATPTAAFDEFERTLLAENFRLKQAVDDDDDIILALTDHLEALARALSEVKKVFTAQAPARTEKAPQSKRARVRPISALERGREEQGDLIADPKAEGA